MMDMSLLKDPVFLLIGISNVFGMAGLYVPFVYLVDAAVLDVRSYLIITFKLTRLLRNYCMFNDIDFFSFFVFF